MIINKFIKYDKNFKSSDNQPSSLSLKFLCNFNGQTDVI